MHCCDDCQRNAQLGALPMLPALAGVGVRALAGRILAPAALGAGAWFALSPEARRLVLAATILGGAYYVVSSHERNAQP